MACTSGGRPACKPVRIQTSSQSVSCAGCLNSLSTFLLRHVKHHMYDVIKCIKRACVCVREKERWKMSALITGHFPSNFKGIFCL